MDLYFADWGLARQGEDDVLEADSPLIVQNGTPIIVDAEMRPLEPWCTFLRLYSQNLRRNTVLAYARDALEFARFLDRRGVGVLDVVERDLVAYRDDRFNCGISMRSWARQLVVIRALFTYLYETGSRNSLPWIKVGSRSVVTPRVPNTAMDVRAISHSQWIALRNIGFGGELPNGGLDHAFRGSCTVRNTCAAELALTTGMRLTEWSTLLDVEIRSTVGGTSVVLEACAKNARRRRVYVPASTVQKIELYRSTERKAVVRKAQAYLHRKLPTLAVVNEVDLAAGKLVYTWEGVTRREEFAQLPPTIRRRLVTLGPDDWIEPQSLFVSRSGLPPSQRRWHQYFEAANERLARFEGQIATMPAAITPHDLRHTFAIVMLRSLQARAAQFEYTRPRYGFGTISEHIVHNPLLTLQRLLGHSSPSTTMEYLRYVDESDELIQAAFESWSDNDRDYASYVLELLEAQRA
ncbi:tyrosine-type recombinase/integrase [Mycobacterium senegalense]|uniref:tyrosine-type recombinase/integrase n=1 Tax=Mycolicibacterium senegalense TaxID=1796 RepID=UPI0022225B1D|nr:tyrosine-type recombinase/integrase [Mycolicibacterium senegalense]MCW1824997.1 tyrosine-type recombinase/integrase [Mycolicibacterium senegalense]